MLLSLRAYVGCVGARRLALGIESFICPTQESKRSIRVARLEGLPALRREFEANGTEVDKQCMRYVLDGEAVADLGLEGDHRMSKTPGSGRQVTLISQEFMTQIAAHLGQADLDPARLRRNIVVSDLNLNALRRQRFWVGEALLEATQLCHPCARMEAELGPGGVIAMFGYGGLCAKVIQGGAIECGAAVRLQQD